MGKIIRSQRKGYGSWFVARTHHRKGQPKYRAYDRFEKTGVVQGKVKEILHDPGRGAPVAVIHFENLYGKCIDRKLFIATEGMYTGMRIESGKGAPLITGNTIPVGELPEGTVIFNVEMKPGDGGKLARASGNFVTVVSHRPEDGVTKLRMPSGSKREVDSRVRGTIGIAAGGGRTDKPMLNGGRQHYKFISKKKSWPVVRCVAKNPVDHPHGGGSHEHVGHPKTVARQTPRGRKVGLIAARRTGRRLGSLKRRD